MLQNLPIILSGIFFLAYYSQIMLTAPIILRIMLIYVILIPQYEYDIVVIIRVRGEAEYEC